MFFHSFIYNSRSTVCYRVKSLLLEAGRMQMLEDQRLRLQERNGLIQSFPRNVQSLRARHRCVTYILAKANTLYSLLVKVRNHFLTLTGPLRKKQF